ncbi:MAG: Inositol 2-dehydrogenase, partial [Planctomycetota bacterium]
MNNTRRGFLSSCATLAAAAGVPYFHSTPRTLADETKSKNDRFTIGLIGA